MLCVRLNNSVDFRTIMGYNTIMKTLINLRRTANNECEARVLDNMGRVSKETFSCERNAQLILLARYKDVAYLNTSTFDNLVAGGCFN